MIRRTKLSVLVVTALIHLFADVAFAGGAILCVGPNDHLAIEFECASTACCQAAIGGNDFGRAVAESEPGNCTDIPLHSEAELVPRSDNGADYAPDFVTLPVFRPSVKLASESCIRTLDRRTGLPPDLRAHRTIVLLL